MKWYAFHHTKVESAIVDQSTVGKLRRNLGSFACIEIDGRLAKHNAVAFAIGRAKTDPAKPTHILLIRAPNFRFALNRAPDYAEPNKRDYYQVS